MVEQNRESALGWNRFLTELETFLTTANRDIDSASASTNDAQFIIERFDICVRVLFSLCTKLKTLN